MELVLWLYALPDEPSICDYNENQLKPLSIIIIITKIFI